MLLVLRKTILHAEILQRNVTNLSFYFIYIFIYKHKLLQEEEYYTSYVWQKEQ